MSEALLTINREDGIMKTLIGLLAVLCLLGGGSGYGQGILSCNECRCVADNTCSDLSCTDDTGCPTFTFTAACGGTHYLKSVLTCSAGSICGECYACAILYEESTGGTIISHTLCTSGGCTDSVAVTLNSGGAYKLKTCLRKCPGYSCDGCSSCTARAYVYTTWSACNGIPACNP